MLPKIPFEKIVPEKLQIKIVEPQHVDGNVQEYELPMLANMIAHFKPKSVFEFGTFDGRTTINMAINAPYDAKIFTLDLPKNQIAKTKFKLDKEDLKYAKIVTSGSRYMGKEGSGKIVQLFGDSATFDYKPYLGKIDFIFVDGSHAKAYIKNDTETALRLRSKNGVILWHDYASVWPDVTNTLDELQEENLQFKRLSHIEGTTFAILC
jgi:predicted O-methyltransferase YrrM